MIGIRFSQLEIMGATLEKQTFKLECGI